jgi:uncharacterized protein
VTVRRLTLDVDDPAIDHVDAAVHRPSRADNGTTHRSVLLAPGAGGDLDGDGLTALAATLAARGCTVVRANLPYRQAGRRAPRADRSVPGYLAVLAAAQQAVGPRDEPWVVGGKSYGGRVATMAVADGLVAAGVLLYGYPLHPPGKPDRLRVDHWPRLGAATLFLQGDRDPFCDLRLLEEHRHKQPRRATVHVVEGGDHSLRVTRAASPTGTASSEAATLAGLGDVLDEWLRRLD